MAKATLLCLGLLLWVGVEALGPEKDYQRMRELGQNAKYGPNLLGHSKFLRHPKAEKPVKSAYALEDYLLPDDVRPLHYLVELIPYLNADIDPDKEFTFDGHVDIRVIAERPTSTIVMHAKDLTIDAINVTQVSNGAQLTVIDWTVTLDDREFLTINLGSTLASGQEYLISINFVGFLNNNGFGFFRSIYLDENQNLQRLGTTQFESTGARMAFPCLDEPNLKATFIIALARAPDHNCVANMPLESTYGDADLPSGWVWDRFQETPLMSSYLVAFTVSKFNRLESPKDSRFAVWAREPTLMDGAYANDIAPDHFNYYQDYTATDYGMPKVDQLGYQDFFSGAMENWGHISYTEQLLLVDPDNAPAYDVQLVTQVVSHELTHQWFGDIISPEWWSDLWLNEGFATYFEFFATDYLNPTWNMQEQFQADMMHSAMSADANIFSSHPVHAEVDSPNSIDSIFDSMSYNKGGCLVRFMLNLMGADNFRSGIIDYMTQHAYTGVHQDDLFAALAPHVPTGLLPDGVSFAQLMDTWTMQAGVPVLTVTRDYQAQTAQITQDRFGINGDEQWIVPITLTSQSQLNFDDQLPRQWLMTAETQIGAAEGVPTNSNEWLLLNIQQTGYYRVNYDQANWDMLFAYMDDVNTADLIHPLNRAQIIDDSLALGATGHLDYKTALTSTRYLNRETALGPWMTALTALEFIRDRMYQSPETVSLFDGYLASKLETVFDHVSGLQINSEETHSIAMTRSVIAKWACKTGVQKCNDEGLTLSTQWQQESSPDTNNPIHQDVRSVSYCAGVRHGDLNDFNFYMARYVNSQNTEEQVRILGALGCALDASTLKFYLSEIIKMDSGIRDGDALSAFFSVYSNPIGIDLALDFLIQNYSQLKTKMDIGLAFMAISEKLNTQEHYQKILMFLEDSSTNLSSGELEMVETALTTSWYNMEWNKAHLADVILYFVQNRA